MRRYSCFSSCSARGSVSVTLNRSPSMVSRKSPPWMAVRLVAMDSPSPLPSVDRSYVSWMFSFLIFSLTLSQIILW